MALRIDEIENPFFRFLAGELPLQAFEQWLYSTPEIESYLGQPAYLEFISFDFRQPAVNYELSKLIYKYIAKTEFHAWQIKRLLKNLLDGTQDTVDVFEKLYDLYCKGYGFLRDIGIQYVLGIDEIPRLVAQDLWDENEFFRRRKMLENYLEPMKEEIKILLMALETGEIKVVSENEYIITPELSDKLKSLPKVLPRESPKKSARVKKAWWKLW
jgi:hypothetical protein